MNTVLFDVDLLNSHHINHNHIPNNQAWILCAVRGQIPMFTFFQTDPNPILNHLSWVYSCCYRSCSFVELSSQKSQ